MKVWLAGDWKGVGFLWNPRYLNSSSIGNDLERGSYVGNSHQIYTEVDPTTRAQRKVGEIQPPKKQAKMVSLPTWNLPLLFSLGRQKWSAENPTCLNKSFNNLQSYQAQRCPPSWGRSWIPARFLSEVNRRILQSPEELLTYEDSEAESEKKGGF